jgi:outer membrane receptor protein involved in Fe transport
VIDSGTWQETYVKAQNLPPDPYWTAAGQTYSFDNEWGEQKYYNGRLSLEWDPSEALSALFTLNGFWDKGQSQMPQLVGITPLNPINAVNPLVANYPSAPRRADAGSWGPCVNISGGTPANVSGQINLSNRLYDTCHDAEKDNKFYSPSLHVDYNLTDDLTLTSLTSYNHFERDQQLESDGTIYQDYESSQDGKIETVFQELRIAGSVRGKGSWVFGVNYEHTRTWDSFMQTYGISTAVPTQVITATRSARRIRTICSAPTRTRRSVTSNTRCGTRSRCKAACVTPISSATTAAVAPTAATARGRTSLRRFRPCSRSSPARWHRSAAESDVGPGKCASTGPGPTFFPVASGFEDKLNQDNVSWRTGINWTPTDTMLLYANVNEGYKSGSFPTVASAAFLQLFPAKQEKLLAYEIGGKFGLFDGRLQLNAATFYYDYTDKQILGAINDAVFGSLPALVNVPESHVIGWRHPQPGSRSTAWYSRRRSATQKARSTATSATSIRSSTRSPTIPQRLSRASRSRTRRNGSRTSICNTNGNFAVT